LSSGDGVFSPTGKTVRPFFGKYRWVKNNGENVKWKYKARWVVDKKYYTSSGISAGIDMSLGFVCDRFGEEKAKEIAKKWNMNGKITNKMIFLHNKMEIKNK
jgi:hypothetical protein